jgi:hypothetical protein
MKAITRLVVANYDKNPLSNRTFKKPLKWIDGTHETWDNKRSSFAKLLPSEDSIGMSALIVPDMQGYMVFIIDDKVGDNALSKIMNEAKGVPKYLYKFPYKIFKSFDLNTVKKLAEKFFAAYVDMDLTK